MTVRPGLPTTSPMMRMFMSVHAGLRGAMASNGSRYNRVPSRDPVDPTDTLLALAAATTWDGGGGVVSALKGALSTLAPFDAGELALSMPTGYRRWTFTEDESPLAADDLLFTMCRRDTILRIDEPSGASAFPETSARLRRRGFMSLLAVPLHAAGGPDGAVVLARSFGWAFSGTFVLTVPVMVALAGLRLE